MASSASYSAQDTIRTFIPPIHPCGVTIEIVGIERSDGGRSCEEHDVCGTVLHEDCVVRIRHMQIIGEHGKEESALAVYWISDGIDRCHVGFLPRHLLKQWQQYDGRIAQVVDLYKGSESPTKRRKNARNYGCCEAVLIDYCEEDSRRPRIATGNDNDDEDHNKQQSHNDYDNAGAKRHRC
jgi:hypothetical protein